ncbi:hypothetical protein KBI5_18625 [Frankia sp. KB5]|nr:hypothetical protein KBI5_18625 [Frankia sp. KB5]
MRHERGLTIRQLSIASGVRQTALVRIEQDEVQHPLPDNLAALAKTLEVRTSDLFLLAGVPLPEDLPSLDVMLRAEYDLPEAGIREAEASIQEIVARYRKTGPGHSEDTTTGHHT